MNFLPHALIGFLILAGIWIGRDLVTLRKARRSQAGRYSKILRRIK